MDNDNNKVRIYFNYKRKNKWLGIIDYKTLVVIGIYIFIVISILKIIPIKIEYLIYFFIFLVVPVIAILLINIENDSAIDMLMIILKYSMNNDIFVKKEYIKNIQKDIYINYRKKKVCTQYKRKT